MCNDLVLLSLFLVFTVISNWIQLQALDHVIAEARKQGIRLLLTLVNNLQAYGGKTQYVNWAWQEGIGLSSSNDSFFFDPSIRIYFKNYVKVICSSHKSLYFLGQESLIAAIVEPI